MRIARVLAWYVDERRGLPAQLVQPGLDVIELSVVEARAHSADVVQAVRGRDSHQQRSDSAATAALTGAPSADHHFLHAMKFDLEPGMGAPSRLVGRIAAFRNDAFELKSIGSRHGCP